MNPIPRLRFAHLPTPIEPLQRLSEYLGGPRLLIKRDDQTGLALGGNKTRKLEFLVAEAQAQGARTLITAGAIQSNHARQTAAAAARFGMGCILVLVGEEPGADSGNLTLDRLFGAELVWTTKAMRETQLKAQFEQAWEAGRRPYLIPYGGSSPTGAAGYVVAMEEFVLQNAAADWIVFPSSSGGTQAGLALGAEIFGYRGKVLGISVDEAEDVLRQRVVQLANETAQWLGASVRLEADQILVNADYLGGGYGVAGEAEWEALRLFGQREGIVLDPVYTGRAAAGLIDLIRRGRFGREETILFWHTGGAPALFADAYRTHRSE